MIIRILLGLTLAIIIGSNVMSLSANSTMGKTTAELNQRRRAQIMQVQLQNQVLFWQEQIATKPNYRDGYLALALLSWQLKRDFDWQKFLDRAYQLDPNYQKTSRLMTLLKLGSGDY